MKTKPFGVRFEEERADLLETVCRERGEDVSDFIRRATFRELARLSYLSDESKKALGFKKKSDTVGGEQG